MPSTMPMGMPRAVERAALLDVQLDVGVPRPLGPHRLFDAIGITADPPEGVGTAQAVPRLVHVAGLEVAGHDAAARRAAAEGRALFVGPDHHLQRMARRPLAAFTASSAPSEAITPRSPSKLPPLGTESMCDPNRMGGRAATPPQRA